LNNKSDIYDDLESKVIFITGAASGIGKATADLFTKMGSKTFRVDISFEKASAARRSAQSVEFGADLRNSAEVRSSIAECEENFGGIHAIVNCAGIEMKGTVLDLSEESFDRVFDTNVKSIFLTSKYGIPVVQKTSANGSIINLASDLGILPIPGVDAYAASKGAIISLTKAMSKNWAKSGLRINCVAPGPIDTPLLRRFQDDKTLEFVRQFLLPQGRLGSPEEVAQVVAFLASEKSSLINGAVLTANGGLVS